MVATIQKILPHNPKEPVYFITFEDYLKPKCISKKPKPLLLTNKNHKKAKLRLRLLEHPVLVAGRKSKWRIFKQKLQKIFKVPKTPSKSTTRKFTENVDCNTLVIQAATRWHNKTFKSIPSCGHLGSIKLPNFLSFLRARNDDGLCKRKSGFEIYCEMASIHGFVNFVGSTTGQRAFWCFVILVAITISGCILIMSHILNATTPTILYTESTQYPSWSIPFPGVTICNLNRISKSKAKMLAESFHKPFNLTASRLLNFFRLVLYTTDNIDGTSDEYRQLAEVLENNTMSFVQLLEALTPDCVSRLQRCKWKGRYERCSKLFKKVNTAHGVCCSFNEHSLKETIYKRSAAKSNQDVEYTTSCGPENGLSVLLDPDLQDYQLSSRKTPGFQVLLHDAYDYTHSATTHSLLIPRTMNRISVTPQQTHTSDYITTLEVPTRRCYLHQERKLFHFPSYSQENCLVECRSSMLYEKCQCSLANWPRKTNWSVCGLKERECFFKNQELLKPVLKSVTGDYRYNHYAEKFICDCYPLCDFNLYTFFKDSGNLDRQFSLTDKRFFKDINITQHILLHVFYEELYAERLRFDIYENWLSFIGTFGGITGLHMGYSVVSGFEMIFFVFVRPACNWLTKKQIRYRIKRRQRKAKLEAEKKRKAQEEKERQDKIEAFLRMRPHCPDY